MKTLDEFVALFAEQFDETDPETIKADTAFHDLDEFSSLIGLSLIAMVDEEFRLKQFSHNKNLRLCRFDKILQFQRLNVNIWYLSNSPIFRGRRE